jgi:DNA modification methylase
MNTLYYGDNLQVLRDSIATESIDLIYLDPPFNSQATYNVLFKAPTGEQSEAQIEAFEDTWHWNDHAENAFDEVMKSGNSDVAELLRALRSFLKENDVMAYLTMMAIRLLELHRVLKSTGTMYLHCDPTASHYLKLLLDSIFGPKRFLNEIIWKRSSAHSDAKQGMKRCGRIHDVIFFYSKGDECKWNTLYTPYTKEYLESEYKHTAPDGRRYKETDLTAAKPGGDTEYEWHVKRPWGPKARWEADLDNEYKNPKAEHEYKAVRPYKGRYWAYSKANLIQFAQDGCLIHRRTGAPRLVQYADSMLGIVLQDLWDDIPPVAGGEDLGYPTQKPLSLLERIITESSDEGDTVLDPFCGCGTAVHAANKLRRNWIGIDITHLAISLIEKRLRDAFPGVAFDVHGTPKDMEGAHALAAQDKYQFQWWAVSLVDAVPYGGKKKGADTGIDGLIYFKPDGKTTEKAIVSVKGGENVNVAMIRDLAQVVHREKAKIGVFLTLADATGPMKTEAVKEGYFETPYGKYPKIQILTISDLFQGKRPKIPLVDPAAFKKAAKESEGGEQDKLRF